METHFLPGKRGWWFSFCTLPPASPFGMYLTLEAHAVPNSSSLCLGGRQRDKAALCITGRAAGCAIP